MSGGFKVDVSRGGCVDRVLSEWFSRPDDERYLSLYGLSAKASLLRAAILGRTLPDGSRVLKRLIASPRSNADI